VSSSVVIWGIPIVIVGQVLAIFNSQKPVVANHPVDFILRFALDVRGQQHGEEEAA
jgi:hypothetical protein